SVGSQGVRQRVVHPDLSVAARGDGAGRHRQARLAWRDSARTPRIVLPDCAGADLRRRHQRGAARHHRDGRAPDAPATAVVGEKAMDFSFSETEDAVRQLARQVLVDHATDAAAKAVDATPERFHKKLRATLASAGLLGTALPEEFGGSGHGLTELCVLLEEAGAA